MAARTFCPRRLANGTAPRRSPHLGYVSRIFPGYVLEREDTRPYPEPRFQVVGELAGELYVVVYTPRGRGCRFITAWIAEPRYWELWNDLTR